MDDLQTVGVILSDVELEIDFALGGTGDSELVWSHHVSDMLVGFMKFSGVKSLHEAQKVCLTPSVFMLPVFEEMAMYHLPRLKAGLGHERL